MLIFMNTASGKRNFAAFVAGVCFLWCWLPMAVAAEEQPLIEVRSMVDTSTITIGDRITYSIIIDRQEDLRAERPGEGVNLGQFEIKDYEFHEPRERDGRIIERFDFHISVYDTGRYTIPAFPIAYFPSDTSDEYSIIEASPIDINVQSVISGEGARELKDIKPPVDIPFNYVFWISMAVAAVLALIIVYLAYRLWKHRQEKGYLITPPKPPRPAHEIALEALNRLYQTDMIENGEYKRFFTELSVIMRVYLENRYFISAMEETTSEILHDLNGTLDDAQLRQDLQELLMLSDLVKFAKHIPQTDEIARIKELASGFIHATRLMYEAEHDEENSPDKGVPADTNEKSDSLPAPDSQ